MNEPIPTALYRYRIQQLAKKERPKTIVEVGVYCADLSRLLLPINGVESLVLVDPWVGGWKSQGHMDLIAGSVMTWARTDGRVKVIREPSVEASKRIKDESVDFWHLDADHTYDAVKADLLSWQPKMRPGSLMTGDNFEIPGVAKAVRERFGSSVKLDGEGRIWLFRV